MSKSTIILLIYSVVLLTLFTVLCYLMTMVNPEPIKSDRIRKFGSDDFFYPNDILLSNDNVAFGLEKVGENYYEDNDVERREKTSTLSTVLKLRSRVSKANDLTTKLDGTKITPNDRSKTNCTRKQSIDFDKKVTRSIRLPLRGLRRSINKENEQNFYMDSPHKLTLKIKIVDNEPKIEIKITSDDKKGEKYLRNQRSTSFKIISKGLLMNNTNITLDNKNNTVIQLGENDMLVINALNKFNYDNDTNYNEDGLENVDSDKLTLDLGKLYAVNLLDDNPDKQNIESRKDPEPTNQPLLRFTKFLTKYDVSMKI